MSRASRTMAAMNEHTKTNVNSDGIPYEPQPLQVVAEDAVEVKIRVTFQARDESKGRKHRMRSEQVVGDDYTHATKKWNKKHRLIDVDNNWYSEKVIDSETGEILHFCEEPLDEHRDHGSAKRSKRQPWH